MLPNGLAPLQQDDSSSSQQQQQQQQQPEQQERERTLAEGDNLMMEITGGLEVVHLGAEEELGRRRTESTAPMEDNNDGAAPAAAITPPPPPGFDHRRPYDDIFDAGPAAPPIEFDRPRFQKGRRAAVLCYHPETGGHEQLENVLLRDYSREFPDGDMRVTRAYWPHPFKAPIKTIMGHVEICVVLERCNSGGGDSSSDDSSSSEEDDDEEEDVVFQTTDEYVAVKVNYSSQMERLRGRHAEDPLKEISAMQLIGNDHPNVLGCIEVLFDGDNLNVVLPFCANGDLFEFLQESERAPDTNLPGMSENVARYWFRQIVEGMRYIHSVGLCHRDMSPENIMIHENTSLIIDMGMSLRIPYTDPTAPHDAVTDISRGTRRRLITSQGACGKRPYMAPEIYRSPISHEPFDGCAADVWTAGTIFFCMITGNRSYEIPHESDTQFYWMTRGLSQLLQDWQVELTDEGYDLLHNMLQVDPRMRLSVDEIENHPWFAHADGVPTTGF